MDQAEGFEAPSSSNGRLMYKLSKSLYGLKQKGRVEIGTKCYTVSYKTCNQFIQSPVDNCVYTKQFRIKIIVMLVWVDGIIIAASDMVLMSKVKQEISHEGHG